LVGAAEDLDGFASPYWTKRSPLRRRNNLKSNPVGKAASAAAAAIILFVMTGCSGGGGGAASSGDAASVVVETSFDLKTIDPARQFEPTGSMLDHALYESLLTFKGGDVSKPTDGLASFKLSDGDKVMTLTMKDGATFSDGSPVTVDDAVFSLQRVQGIAGNPSFMLKDVKIEKTADKTLTLTSPRPNPALAFILPNPSLGIVNSKVVKENGGTTDKDDKAEAFLNKTSAGSGSYTLSSYDANSQVVLEASPKYHGTAPAKKRVVVRNVAGETQALNIQSGESQVALDLNPDQVKQLDKSAVNVLTEPSTDTVYLMMNQSPAISAWTSNADFNTAVKFGLDYGKILALAGDGAARPGGVVPSEFLGALPTEKGLQFDFAAAKKSLAASGYNGEEVVLSYPNDITLDGLQMQPFAETIQSQLKAVGINLKLAPGPEATELDNYRAGNEQMGLWTWGADYPDPSDYLVYLPGQNLGLRAVWKEGANSEIDSLGAKAVAASGDAARSTAYQDLQIALNERGPFVSLFQPVKNLVTVKSIESAAANPLWLIDIENIK